MDVKIPFDSSNTALLPQLPTRRADSHKGDCGRLLCVCTSIGMAGAGYLCAKAAYRTGAGIVEIFAPEENRAVLQTLIPEAIVTVYDPSAPDLHLLRRSVERSDAIVVGCGLSTSASSVKILGEVLRAQKRPTLLDADALNIISLRRSLLKYAEGCIITPHLGEMSRLTEMDVPTIAKDTSAAAYEFANTSSLVCVLKSHKTVVSDGKEKLYINKTGNSGMATGGSGDVLAGIIGGILAQNKRGELTDFEAAVLGVYLHSFAGDIAANKLGEYSLMASDIIDALPEAIKEFSVCNK